jgi:general secretion pathway protein D
VNWAVFSKEDGKVVPGALFNSPIGSSAPLDLAGLAQAVDDPSSVTSVPAGAIFGVGKVVDSGISWAAMIRAVLAKSDTNVIGNPRQMTLDNEQATLTSGQNVPFLSGQYTNSGNNTGGGGGNINPFSTVQRQDIGTTLKITPRLNGNDKMTLTIDLESSELAGQTGDAGSQITNKRTFHNVVIVKDQQWLVVGGMIRDSEAVGESRVPLLSRIPVLGNLFKVKNKRRQKSNLMVFIKPTIITDDLQAVALTGAKYKELQDMQEIQRTKGDLPSPQLPSLDPSPVAAPPRTNGVPQTTPVP